MLRQVRELSLTALVVVAGCTKAREEPAPKVPASAPAPAAAAPTSKAEAAEYEVNLIVGQPSHITIAARAGYHVNEEYPVSFTPQGGARQSLREVLEMTPCEGGKGACRAEAPLSLPSPAVGVLAFSVCSDEKCLIEKVTLSGP